MATALDAQSQTDLFGVVFELDADADVCRGSGCDQAFGMLNRKHHCRFCGRIYCGRCSDFKMKHPSTGTMERSCKDCIDKENASQLFSTDELPRQYQDPEDAANAAKYGCLWKPDAEAIHCAGCWGPFTATNRKHHCRKCGDIFCGGCSAQMLLHTITGTNERTCDSCVKNDQVDNAIKIELKSPQFILRAAALLVALIAMLLAFSSGYPLTGIISMLALVVAAGNLYVRYCMITQGISFKEFAAKTLDRSAEDDVSSIVILMLIFDVLICTLTFFTALVALFGVLLLALVLLTMAGIFGASSWYSWVDSASAIHLLMNPAEHGREQVSTRDPEAADE